MTPSAFQLPSGSLRRFTRLDRIGRTRLRTLALAAAVLAGAGAAAAETRIFLIENSDGYGVDTCLADGAPCGGQVANAWCRAHDYSQALDYGRVAVTGSTGIMTIAGNAKPPACTGSACEPVVAIACSR